MQQCLDEIEALGQNHADLLQNICVEALMPPDVDPGAGGQLTRCLLMEEGEALLKAGGQPHARYRPAPRCWAGPRSRPSATTKRPRLGPGLGSGWVRTGSGLVAVKFSPRSP